jgi:NAD(P)-dependent dehydrogenase (short-subunit alcohol dehydrogenase family)
VRDAIGEDTELLIEMHGRFTPAVAVAVARDLERFDPAWIEEPVPPENPKALAKVAERVNIPVATGERVHSRFEFRELLELQAADILQPDIAHFGGILETRKLAAAAETHYVLVAPHNVCGPVATAANLHLAACTPNFKIQEHFNDFADAWVLDVAPGLPAVDSTDGCFALPTEPGLGVTLDWDAVAGEPVVAGPRRRGHRRRPRHRRGDGARARRCGRRVAVLDLDVDSARETADALPGEALAASCDVTEERSVSAALEQVRSELGPVSVLVNNAGVNTYFDPGEMTLEEWERAFAVDLRGAWLCVKHALDDLRAADGASIDNVASIHATLTTPGMFPYAAAKSGLVGMTRSLALDLGPDGIRVNAVSPGFTRTRLVDEWFEQQPDPDAARAVVLGALAIGRMVEPEEVGRLIRFLASDDAAAITGTEIHIDGGHSARFTG